MGRRPWTTASAESVRASRCPAGYSGRRTASYSRAAAVPTNGPASSALPRTGSVGRTVTAAFSALGKQGVVRELTGKRRNRVYGYVRFLEILGEGGEQSESG